MPYEPLHHKYRPQTFADLVGQDAIATTLTNAIRQNRIAPAYLLTGPRGTGKTSSARILAKSLNCLSATAPTETPCGQCEVCRTIANGTSLDTIEIDAASNTGVDNIRELIERAQFAPVQSRYKVYLIDEVHMLSTAAFNALLKTLEEPPPRVIFVLATTDPQRVLPTIISRCQRFDFRRIPIDPMVQHLKYIALQETIDITNEAVITVAQIAQGGLRDAESLLDQLSLLAGQVTVEGVWDLVGAVPERDLIELLGAIAQDNPEKVLDRARELMNRGREPLIVLQNLASFYRDLLIAKTAPSRPDLVALTAPTWEQLCQVAREWEMGTILAGQQHLRSCEAQIKNTTQPRLWLEVTLLGLLPSAIATQIRGGEGASSPRSVSGATQAPTGRSPAVSPVPPPAPAAPGHRVSPGPEQPSAPGVPSPHGSDESGKRSDRQVPSTPTASAPVSVNPPTPPAGDIPQTADLGQIWATVLAHLSPGSKALFNQHGSLIAFSDGQAGVAIRSPKLFKVMQNKLSDLETAFFKAFDRKIKVILQVAGEPMSNPVTGREPSTADGLTHEAPSSSPPASAAIAPQGNRTPPPGSPNPPPAPENQVREIREKDPAPVLPVGGIGMGENRGDRNGGDNEVMGAAEQFSHYFKGKLLTLPDDPEICSVEARSLNEQSGLSQSSEGSLSNEIATLSGDRQIPDIAELENDPYGGLDF